MGRALVHANVLTLFPGYFAVPLEQSITGRARSRGLFSWDLIDLRTFVREGEQVDEVDRVLLVPAPGK